MQNILLEITRKNILIGSGILLLLAYLFIIRLLIMDKFKSFTRKKGERRTWEIKEDPLSEGVIENDDDDGVVEGDDYVSDDDDSVTPEEEESFKKLELLAAEIERLFSKKNQDRETLMLALANTIRTYSELNEPPFRTAINNLIIRGAKQQCFLTITEDEANSLWLPA